MIRGNQHILFMLIFQETNDFFQRHFKRRMSKHDRLEFLNLWYVLIIINDILLIGGSIIKELMENQVIELFSSMLYHHIHSYYTNNFFFRFVCNVAH